MSKFGLIHLPGRVFVAVLAFTVAASAGPASAAPSAKASRYASIVVEAETGLVLYERNADIPRYPASLTKIMTLYLTFEALASKKLALTDYLVFSAHASRQDPSRLDLAPGSKLKVEDAIRAMTTKSANDAACALAERLSNGSEARFGAAMTAKGKALGLKQTTFLNASGLPDSGHISSARDLAQLSRALVRDFPQYYEYFATPAFEFHGKRYPNQNRFLRTYYGADGIKTGFVNASGHNLSASAVRGGKRLIAVVLGGDTQAWTREHATRLLDVSYAKIDPSLVMVASNATVESAPAAKENSPSPATARTATAPAGIAPVVAAIAAATAPGARLEAATETGEPARFAASIPLPNATARLKAYAAAAPAPAAKTASAPAVEKPTVSTASLSGSAARPATVAAAPPAGPQKSAPPSPATSSAKTGNNQPGESASVSAPEAPPAQKPAATPREAQDADSEDQIARQLLVRRSSPPAPQRGQPELTPPPAAPATQKPAPVVDQGSTPEYAPDQDWSVQIGLYKDATVARRRGEEARSRLPLGLRGADLVVGRSPDGTHIVSRIGHLSEQDARAGCSELQRGRVPCVVVPPGRSLFVATN